MINAIMIVLLVIIATLLFILMILAGGIYIRLRNTIRVDLHDREDDEYDDRK